ncbi:MAG: RNA polymerase factor sigma-54 [Filifactor alocis]|nr:RNA polymerase factor sigma-54 [Filifactor alocis]
MNFELQLKQTQKMILTRELKQSLEILQMNSFQLQEHIAKEVEENPLLEASPKDDTDWENYVKDIQKHNLIRYEKEENYNNDYNPENYIAGKVTLYEHIQEELSMIDFDREQRYIAEDIVRQLDDDGYFRLDVEDYCQSRGISQEKFESVLSKIQTVEPIGIGARSLEEALLLQLKARNLTDEILIDIVQNDLSLVADRKFPELEKKYHLSSKVLADYIDIIRTLEPKPGRNFSSEDTNYIVPDVFVEIQNEEVDVFFNEYSVPSIYISSLFTKELLHGNDKETKDYIKDRLNKANLLIKNIEQRKNTVLKIAKAIVETQMAFFTQKNAPIAPMLMKDIANLTGFHESTVSRTVNGKYMMTPKGLYEFRFFFSSRIEGQDGTSYSNIDVKKEIKRLIDEEDKVSPLSDQKIADLLLEREIAVSRRTIAKYREEMEIASSSKRKELRR